MRALLLVLPLCACISSSPPAPPVRYFDPAPTFAPAAAGGRPVRLEVEAAPALRPEFEVRIGPREVAWDQEHRWIAEPRDLLAAALHRALFASGVCVRSDDLAATVRVYLSVFELDLTSAPQAKVQFGANLGGRQLTCRGSAPSADASAPALAEAMAAALQQAVTQLQQELGRPGG